MILPSSFLNWPITGCHPTLWMSRDNNTRPMRKKNNEILFLILSKVISISQWQGSVSPTPASVNGIVGLLFCLPFRPLTCKMGTTRSSCVGPEHHSIFHFHPGGFSHHHFWIQIFEHHAQGHRNHWGHDLSPGCVRHFVQQSFLKPLHQPVYAGHLFVHPVGPP